MVFSSIHFLPNPWSWHAYFSNRLVTWLTGEDWSLLVLLVLRIKTTETLDTEFFFPAYILLTVARSRGQRCQIFQEVFWHRWPHLRILFTVAFHFSRCWAETFRFCVNIACKSVCLYDEHEGDWELCREKNYYKLGLFTVSSSLDKMWRDQKKTSTWFEIWGEKLGE